MNSDTNTQSDQEMQGSGFKFVTVSCSPFLVRHGGGVLYVCNKNDEDVVTVYSGLWGSDQQDVEARQHYDKTGNEMEGYWKAYRRSPVQ